MMMKRHNYYYNDVGYEAHNDFEEVCFRSMVKYIATIAFGSSVVYAYLWCIKI